MYRSHTDRLLLIVHLLLFIPALVSADKIDELVTEQIKKQRIPGISLAVVRKGKLVKAKGYGLADVENRVPATKFSVYEIGSITKQFTASAIMFLANEDKLALDDRITQYVSGLPESWGTVTVQHLLAHTSGIPDYEAVIGYGAYRNRYTPEEIIKTVSELPLEFKPGDSWSYSNTGYFLLSEIIQKVSGQPYSQFLAERIFIPLGMTATRDSEPTAIIPHRVAGYALQDGELQNRDPIQPSATGGAGVVVSSVMDLVKWDAALSTERILPRTLLRQMWSPVAVNEGQVTGFGLGWDVKPYRGRQSIAHEGQTAGFVAYMRWLPDDRLTLILLSNLYAANLRPVAHAIITHYLPDLSWKKLPEKPDPGMGLRLLAALRQLADGAKQSDLLAPGLATFAASPAFNSERLKALLKEIKTIAFLKSEDISPSRVGFLGDSLSASYLYKLVTDRNVHYVTFWLTADGRLADLQSDDE